MNALFISPLAPFGVRQPSCRFVLVVAGLQTGPSPSVCSSSSPRSSSPSASLRYLSLLFSATHLPRANPMGHFFTKVSQ
jgi:hypothetical protein